MVAIFEKLFHYLIRLKDAYGHRRAMAKSNMEFRVTSGVRAVFWPLWPGEWLGDLYVPPPVDED